MPDRDVAAFGAKLDAHTRTLNALRETQLEHGERLDRLGRELRDGFSTLGTGMARITGLLEGITRAKPD